MTTLHLIRLPLVLRELTGYAIAEGVDDDDYGYAIHLVLRRRFGPAAPQPFRLFADASSGPHLLGYATDVAALVEAALLPPLDPRLDAIFPAPPAARAMPDSWRPRACYSFEVRVRPVIRYGPRARAAREAEGRHVAAERDAFLAALDQDGAAPERGAVYTEWFRGRLADAATIERAAITRMRRIVTRRSPHNLTGAVRIEGYEVLFAGTLAVQEPAAFARLLAHGVGRHAAFGYGMLTLAPPPRG